ncbi:MAG TPA: adenylate/guanylate cyclase domain-containing protein [Casimicrobiaceae bacterium]|nr:adenylate/guanylate cyclase domain-containing protein [Casimicrobiaceae bacterium]
MHDVVETDATAAVRQALHEGLPAIALDRVRAAMVVEAESPELAFLGALACARMGAMREAEAWLARVDADRLAPGALATDVWALAGRIAKERFVRARARADPEAAALAATAIARYRRAFDVSGDAYPLVNAATVASASGDASMARDLATRALGAVFNDDPVWAHATRGESLLLLGRLDEARAAYAAAHAAAGSRHGDVAAMRRQLALIGTPEARALLDVVPAPAVLVFTGHMIDRPGRRERRFPPSLEGAVDAAVRDVVGRHAPAIGFSQAACGADILFLEAMQDAGLQTHVVLPCAIDDFVATSVAFAGASWVRRFERALARATSMTLATAEPLLQDDVLFEHAATLLLGMARLRAAELTSEPRLLAVTRADAEAPVGGTAATSRAWRARGHVMQVIDLATLPHADAGAPRSEASPDGTGHDPAPDRERAARGGARPGGRTIRSLLFADIAGFSRLPEAYTPRFVDTFLGLCKRLLDALPQPVLDAKTLGDGLFVVFERPHEAAQFAMALQSALAAVDWPALGLPGSTRARIGLHTGPVFETHDPVMGKRTFYGSHVNRTARLEPVVQPGHVFATEAFAASLVAEDARGLQCHYIGELPLAKQFGTARLYRVVGDED